MIRRFTLFFLLLILLFPSSVYGRDGSGLVQTFEAPPEQEQETAEPQPTAEPEQSDGPFYGLGNPWAAPEDGGRCGNYYPQYHASSPPPLLWPVDGGTLHPGRSFRIGHTGLDIDAEIGTPVKAARFGVVVWAGESSFFGNGAQLVVIYDSFEWLTFYAHLSAVWVSCYDIVETGEIIGAVGMTGAATFPHLHFELRNGLEAYNPLPYFGAGA